jgi:hypothetical protein
MPIGEIETHPYLHIGETVRGATRLILGSFPVYYCTNEDTPFKELYRADNDTSRFFYGSHRSKFWRLYQSYVDPAITLPIDVHDVLASLSANRIAVSDTIISAERVEYSASDRDLTIHEWNTNGLAAVFARGVGKVLCTSKGVLRDLSNKIICADGAGIGEYSLSESLHLQSDFVEQIGGNAAAVVEPIARVYAMNDGHTVSAICIPSPGSSQRSVQHFGHMQGSKAEYAERYFQQAFDWLLE